MLPARVVALVGASVAIVVLPCATALALPPAATFVASSGAQQRYVVPGGVRLLMVKAIGARGGGDIGVAGLGAALQAVLPVSPGARLYPYVGETSTRYLFGGAPGGTMGGQSGGGASTVRVCAVPVESTADNCGGTVAEPRLIVAGGGGGGAGGGSAGPAVCGVSPIAGSAGTGPALSTTGGVVIAGGAGRSLAPSAAAQGGSSSGGAGGRAATCSVGITRYDRAEDGGAGGDGWGGPGADVVAGGHSTPIPPRYSGGGGGGGYFGGGGGSSGQENVTSCPDPSMLVMLPGACRAEVSGGGGGAGSSFVAATASLMPGAFGASSDEPAIIFTPLLAITRPRNGARYRQHRSLKSRWQCGLTRCHASKHINTSTRGRHVFTVTGELDGVRFRARVHYTVLARHRTR